MKTFKVAALLFFVGLPEVASAADLCRAVVLRPVRPVGVPGGRAERPGTVLTAVTQYARNRRTGQTSICSHGGYCYPTHVRVGGKLLPALRVTNCTVDLRRPDPPIPGIVDDDIIYYFKVDRGRNSAAALRLDDVENRLLEMGMCSACAGTAADAYVHKPNSACGKLTRRVLEGNPVARRELVENDTNVCTALWHR